MTDFNKMCVIKLEYKGHNGLNMDETVMYSVYEFFVYCFNLYTCLHCVD